MVGVKPVAPATRVRNHEVVEKLSQALKVVRCHYKGAYPSTVSALAWDAILPKFVLLN